MNTETVLTYENERCLAVRREVFVREQGVSEDIEIDALDAADAVCDRFLILCDGRDAGTFRCFFETPTSVHLQRFCVLKEYRRRGLGKAALGYAERFYTERGAAEITLNAQCSAVGFYERCGYRAVSDIFREAGIPHRKMVKSLLRKS